METRRSKIETGNSKLETRSSKFANSKLERFLFPLRSSLFAAPCSLFPVPCSLQDVDRTPATRCPARAANGFVSVVVVVIDRQLLALSDPAQAHVKDVLLHDARHEVRRTRVIDELGSRSAHIAVEHPILIENEQARRMRTAVRLGLVDLLSRVLDHLAIGGNRLVGVDAPAVDLRLAEPQAEAAVFGINLRSGGHSKVKLQFSQVNTGLGQPRS